MADWGERNNMSETGYSVGVDRMRRRILGSLLVAPWLARPGAAEDVIELEWSDLLPQSGQTASEKLWGLIEHNEAPLVSQQPAAEGVRTDWNGKIIRLPGYIVPIDYSGTGVIAFILVPFVGACVHVPPPPANQLVFVTTSVPYESTGLFEPVTVTGTFGTMSTSTELAEIGYTLSAEKIDPYS